jgi:hypoxanthine phosphoribosyltransferase
MDNSIYSNISVLIDEKKLNDRIHELGEQISRDYEGKQLKLICILKGSVLFMSELAKRLTVPVLFDFMQVSSYGSGTQSSGSVKIKKDLDDDIAGQDVLIVEDIIDSGNTLYKLKPILLARNPKSLKVVSLLDKPERREVPFEADYHGFEIPDEFVVGYGLDYDQKYRNLPYIGVLHL